MNQHGEIRAAKDEIEIKGRIYNQLVQQFVATAEAH
jgi:hypothetical protein